jgi:hypothetical protein
MILQRKENKGVERAGKGRKLRGRNSKAEMGSVSRAIERERVAAVLIKVKTPTRRDRRVEHPRKANVCWLTNRAGGNLQAKS